MIYKITLTTALLFLPLCGLAADKPDDFSVLSERNMFLKNRQPPPDPSHPRRVPTTEESRPIDPPAKSIVLRGVVIEDSELHAYVEDTRSGDITRLAPGDAVGDGHVASIAIDAISYEENGRTQWIDIGQNLFGSQVAATTQPTTGPSGDSSATTVPANPQLSALEQRMRDRRNRTQRTAK